MVEHVEKQPEEVAEQERSMEQRSPLEVRSEIIMVMNFSLLAIHHKLLPNSMDAYALGVLYIARIHIIPGC